MNYQTIQAPHPAESGDLHLVINRVQPLSSAMQAQGRANLGITGTGGGGGEWNPGQEDNVSLSVKSFALGTDTGINMLSNGQLGMTSYGDWVAFRGKSGIKLEAEAGGEIDLSGPVVKLNGIIQVNGVALEAYIKSVIAANIDQYAVTKDASGTINVKGVKFDSKYEIKIDNNGYWMFEPTGKNYSIFIDQNGKTYVGGNSQGFVVQCPTNFSTFAAFAKDVTFAERIINNSGIYYTPSKTSVQIGAYTAVGDGKNHSWLSLDNADNFYNNLKSKAVGSNNVISETTLYIHAPVGIYGDMDLNNHKITKLANGTSPTDAVNFSQASGGGVMPSNVVTTDNIGLYAVTSLDGCTGSLLSGGAITWEQDPGDAPGVSTPTWYGQLSLENFQGNICLRNANGTLVLKNTYTNDYKTILAGDSISIEMYGTASGQSIEIGRRDGEGGTIVNYITGEKTSGSKDKITIGNSWDIETINMQGENLVASVTGSVSGFY